MRIFFRSQKLNRFLSPAIGKLSKLEELSLPNNQLINQVPPQIVDCKKLEILNLQNNQFFGEVPSGLSSLIRLRILDLSSNKFFGNLNFLKYFPNMEKLLLSNNMFTRKVPVSLRSFRNLRFFNISGNKFHQNPLLVLKGMEFLSAELSEEKTTPKRYSFVENSIDRNQTSAMAPHDSKNSNTRPTQATTTSGKHKNKKSNKKPRGCALGFLAGHITAVLSGMVFSVLFKLLMPNIKDGREGFKCNNIQYDDQELEFLGQRRWTGFVEVIGRGGCGEVYKAVLLETLERILAIKKIIQPPKDVAELTKKIPTF